VGILWLGDMWKGRHIIAQHAHKARSHAPAEVDWGSQRLAVALHINQLQVYSGSLRV
jgi:hypothetical protein